MMHALLSAAAALAVVGVVGLTSESTPRSESRGRDDASIYQFKMRDIDGEEVSLAKYRGQVCLIVNTASR